MLLNNASFADNLTNYNEDFLDNDISQINEDQEDLGEIEYQSEFTSETESGNETVYSSQESLNLSEESIEECEFTYKNSNTTIKDLAMSFLAIKYMHKLSDIVLDDILKLISIIIPENKLPKTSKKLISTLSLNDNEIIENLYCSKCDNVSDVKNIKNCAMCNSELIKFTTFDIIPQLEKILSNQSYVKQIVSANKIRDNKNVCIQDALDGQIYLAVEKKRDILNISLNINSDGAPLIKSRNHSLWPVIGNILELDQSSREKIDNLIISGIWLHNSKPTNKFFYKAFEKLKELLGKEITIKTYKIAFRCQLGLFDLPAKAAIANIKQFNGKFGCPSCFHPGRREQRVQLYPIDKIYKLKNFEDYKYYSDLANQLNVNITDEKKLDSVFGFFGSSPLDDLIKIPEQLPYDYMHLVLQGHSKWIYTKLVSERELEELYLGAEIKNINEILKSIKMPHTIHKKTHRFWRNN